MRLHPTHQTLRALGALLTYPTPDLLKALPELEGVIAAEGWLPNARLAELRVFLTGLARRDLFDAQEDYVDLFDRTPSLSLHLFEHVHGESRERGQALVDLDQLYRERGLHNASEHTPDYLPMFLEYLSLLPVEEARAALDGVVEILAALQQRLAKRNSGYGAVLSALQSVSARKPDASRLKAALAEDIGDVPSNEKLDAAWEEQFALAGLSDGDSCPKAEEILARMCAPDSQTGGHP